ncbi:MAG TPA: hypothetical protein VK893_04340 [Pyrinomonadaceae bacterium]|nr:hypothetical protein [Pyrinomonadaceae bacterium]
MNRRLSNRTAAIAIVVLPLLLASGSLVIAQQNTTPGSNKELSLREIVKLPGKLLTQAKTDGPTSDLKLTGYRIEEVSLPRSVTTQVSGEQVTATTAWRVTVTGGPFPVRAMPAVIWVDDQIAGYGIENEILSEITAITFDRSLIREGAVISLSYGENKEDGIRFAQKTQLKGGGGNQ